MLRPPAARWTLALLLLGACLNCPPAGAVDADRVRNLKQQAEAFEKQGEWEKACELYEAVLRLRRDLPAVKDHYVHCVRRLWQTRRHHDLSYRKEVLSIEYGQAVHLYSVLRDLLLDHSLERKKLNPAKLFVKGLEEFDYALADPYFCQQHIPADRAGKIAEFRAVLLKTWGDVRPANRREAVKQIRDVAMAAQSYLRLNSAVVIMEFTCGACYALDEYTVYLTPAQLRELCSSLRGELVGIGASVVVQDGKYVIQEVEPMGPAAGKLREGDQLVGVDKKPVAALTYESVLNLLEGAPGTLVDVEVFSPMTAATRTEHLRRQTLAMPSVNYFMTSDGTTGILRVSAFQETTPKEVDNALARLSEQGMKALVLDLRGNGGGLFESAVAVARRFLSSGIIATKQHLDDRSNVVTTLCEAKNANALTLPVVVLIDAETASAAEVLAGALKENGRAVLVGQPTYGKGCTQYLLKLPEFKGGLPAGGMRLTVARVFSPKGLPYTGRGVLPDVAVERDRTLSPSPGFDPQRDAAQLEAQRQLAMMMR